MEQILNQILSELKGMKADIKELKEGQNRIENKVALVYDQTAKTCEDITSVHNKLDNLSKDIIVIESVAGKNMTDIANLKLIK
ncbi:hypothetical protein DVV91_10515 [Clostridium botulinum]|uniref:hypothetical protein n=1 Tax=Clostridium botulinum TaxID=1491 RepID=UPI001967049F|nr:hypothetical protein [Clostridium botulinum]MBN1074775.1 hypothetical protein [Clostridium botulinum]